MFPVAARLHRHAHAVAGLHGGHGLHGGAEVGDVQALLEAGGQLGAQEFDDQVLALLADVHPDAVARQIHHHPAGPIAAAAEVDVTDAFGLGVAAFREVQRLGGRRSGAGGGRRGRGRGDNGGDRLGHGGHRHRRHRIQRQHQGLALQLRLVLGGLLEVEHQAGAFTRLGHRHGAQIAQVDLLVAAPAGVAHARQVQRNARWRLQHKSAG